MPDLLSHFWRNRMGVCWPRMTSWFNALREDTSLPIAAAGFCWGGLYAIMLTHDRDDVRTAKGRPFVDASFAAHPSSVSVPGDIEAVKRPMSIAVGDIDAVMSFKQVQEAQTISKNKDVDMEVVIYPGQGMDSPFEPADQSRIARRQNRRRRRSNKLLRGSRTFRRNEEVMWMRRLNAPS